MDIMPGVNHATIGDCECYYWPLQGLVQFEERIGFKNITVNHLISYIS